MCSLISSIYVVRHVVRCKAPDIPEYVRKEAENLITPAISPIGDVLQAEPSPDKKWNVSVW